MIQKTFPGGDDMIGMGRGGGDPVSMIAIVLIMVGCVVAGKSWVATKQESYKRQSYKTHRYSFIAGLVLITAGVTLEYYWLNWLLDP